MLAADSAAATEAATEEDGVLVKGPPNELVIPPPCRSSGCRGKWELTTGEDVPCGL